ncbi:hypothetical protein ACFLV1_02085 [Chloroflexota bacterium]
METGKRLEMLEGELKLMKGEVKETLSSVRDYLQKAKVPSQDTILIPASDNEPRGPIIVPGRISVSGADSPQASVSGGAAASAAAAPAPAAPVVQAPSMADSIPVMSETQPSVAAGGIPVMPADSYEAEDSIEDIGTGETMSFGAPPAPRARAPEPPPYPEFASIPEEVPGWDGQDRIELGPSAPQVNLLANLIRWVASARGEIGSEQLATFLEVYGVTGNLSQELKEVILQLLEISAAQPQDASVADVWSRLILELHGILAGGGAPLQPAKFFGIESKDEEELEELKAEEEKPRYQPLKLKLVYPQGDGTEKEFTIDVNPEADEAGPPDKPKQSAKKQGGDK